MFSLLCMFVYECVILRGDRYKDNSNGEGTHEGQLEEALRSGDMLFVQEMAEKRSHYNRMLS